MGPKKFCLGIKGQLVQNQDTESQWNALRESNNECFSPKRHLENVSERADRSRSDGRNCWSPLGAVDSTFIVSPIYCSVKANLGHDGGKNFIQPQCKSKQAAIM